MRKSLVLIVAVGVSTAVLAAHGGAASGARVTADSHKPVHAGGPVIDRRDRIECDGLPGGRPIPAQVTCEVFKGSASLSVPPTYLDVMVGIDRRRLWVTYMDEHFHATGAGPTFKQPRLSGVRNFPAFREPSLQELRSGQQAFFARTPVVCEETRNGIECFIRRASGARGAPKGTYEFTLTRRRVRVLRVEGNRTTSVFTHALRAKS